MELIRTIHPIGQGAFYSEKFKAEDGHTVNVVYDCGSGTTRTISQPCQDIINGAFNPGEEIDILFISHFHADHINGISTLKNRCNIKKVVIPHIDTNIKNNLQFLASRSADFDAELSFIDPYEFFGQDQTIEIQVNGEDINFQVDGLDINELTTNIYSSGLSISIKLTNDFKWMYRPFCLQIDQDNINHLVDYIKSLPNGIQLEQEEMQKIKEWYAKINSDLNQTSMMVFSAPYDEDANNTYHLRLHHRFHPYYHCCRHCDVCEQSPLECHIEQRYGCFNRCIPLFPSCLYTGDIQLDSVVINMIQTVTKQYMLGTFQIPHHGSDKNWDSSIFDTTCIRRCTQFYLSHGIKNKYGHPDYKTILEFGEFAHVPYCVNENKNSVVIQRFHFK